MTVHLGRKVPLLRDQPTKTLQNVCQYMLAEAQAFGDEEPKLARERDAYLALAAIVDMELRLRDPRRKPMLVSSNETEKK
jgi:hypothetical protein